MIKERKMINRLFPALLIVLLTACTDTDPTESGEHVWKTRTDAMNKARNTQQLLDDAHERQRQQIDEVAQ